MKLLPPAPTLRMRAPTKCNRKCKGGCAVQPSKLPWVLFQTKEGQGKNLLDPLTILPRGHGWRKSCPGWATCTVVDLFSAEKERLTQLTQAHGGTPVGIRAFQCSGAFPHKNSSQPLSRQQGPQETLLTIIFHVNSAPWRENNSDVVHWKWECVSPAGKGVLIQRWERLGKETARIFTKILESMGPSQGQPADNTQKVLATKLVKTTIKINLCEL